MNLLSQKKEEKSFHDSIAKGVRIWEAQKKFPRNPKTADGVEKPRKSSHKQTPELEEKKTTSAAVYRELKNLLFHLM